MRAVTRFLVGDRHRLRLCRLVRILQLAGLSCLGLAGLQAEPIRPHPANPHYFEFRSAAEKGVVVEITLFGNHYGDSQWSHSPLKASNTIHGIGGRWEEDDKTGAHVVSTRLRVGVIQMALGRTVAEDCDRVVAGISNAAAHGVRVAVFPESALRGTAWESTGEGSGWTSHTLRGVAIRTGDGIRLDAEGAGGRLDYVQLNCDDR